MVRVSQRNSRSVTVPVSDIYSSLQLKMPANQATLNKLEAVLVRLELVADKLGQAESSIQKGGSQADIQALVERLEKAAGKLEQLKSGKIGEGK